jgi:hypothetical protein
MGLAEGDAALRTAGGLFARLSVDEIGVDLVEVALARVRRPLGRLLSLQGDKFQHPLGHEVWPTLKSQDTRPIEAGLTPVKQMVHLTDKIKCERLRPIALSSRLSEMSQKSSYIWTLVCRPRRCELTAFAVFPKVGRKNRFQWRRLNAEFRQALPTSDVVGLQKLDLIAGDRGRNG